MQSRPPETPAAEVPPGLTHEEFIKFQRGLPLGAQPPDGWDDGRKRSWWLQTRLLHKADLHFSHASHHNHEDWRRFSKAQKNRLPRGPPGFDVGKRHMPAPRDKVAGIIMQELGVQELGMPCFHGSDMEALRKHFVLRKGWEPKVRKLSKDQLNRHFRPASERIRERMDRRFARRGAMERLLALNSKRVHNRRLLTTTGSKVERAAAKAADRLDAARARRQAAAFVSDVAHQDDDAETKQAPATATVLARKPRAVAGPGRRPHKAQDDDTDSNNDDTKASEPEWEDMSDSGSETVSKEEPRMTRQERWAKQRQADKLVLRLSRRRAVRLLMEREMDDAQAEGRPLRGKAKLALRGAVMAYAGGQPPATSSSEGSDTGSDSDNKAVAMFSSIDVKPSEAAYAATESDGDVDERDGWVTETDTEDEDTDEDTDSTAALSHKSADSDVSEDSNIEDLNPVDNVTRHSLVVRRPRAMVTWTAGSKYCISWACGNPTVKRVRVQLYMRTQLVATIAQNTPNSGYFKWRVPDWLPSARCYRVKVMSRPLFKGARTKSLYGFSAPFLEIKGRGLQGPFEDIRLPVATVDPLPPVRPRRASVTLTNQEAPRTDKPTAFDLLQAYEQRGPLSRSKGQEETSLTLLKAEAERRRRAKNAKAGDSSDGDPSESEEDDETQVSSPGRTHDTQDEILIRQAMLEDYNLPSAQGANLPCTVRFLGVPVPGSHGLPQALEAPSPVAHAVGDAAGVAAPRGDTGATPGGGNAKEALEGKDGDDNDGVAAMAMLGTWQLQLCRPGGRVFTSVVPGITLPRDVSSLGKFTDGDVIMTLTESDMRRAAKGQPPPYTLYDPVEHLLEDPMEGRQATTKAMMQAFSHPEAYFSYAGERRPLKEVAADRVSVGAGGNSMVLHGWGALAFADGGVYEGQVQQDKPHGSGVTTTGLRRYKGTWKEGKKHGTGEENDPWGFHYKGFYLEGERHGRGTLRLPSGATYEGEFKNGKPHGQGLMRSSSGVTYKGAWEDGYVCGTGSLSFGMDDGMPEYRVWPKCTLFEAVLMARKDRTEKAQEANHGTYKAMQIVQTLQLRKRVEDTRRGLEDARKRAREEDKLERQRRRELYLSRLKEWMQGEAMFRGMGENLDLTFDGGPGATAVDQSLVDGAAAVAEEAVAKIAAELEADAVL